MRVVGGDSVHADRRIRVIMGIVRQNIKNSKMRKGGMMTPMRNEPSQNKASSQGRFKYSENRLTHPY